MSCGQVKNNAMKLRVFSALIPYFILGSLFAETIVLNNGSKREGMIIEETDQYVVINYSGVPLKYYYDEIKSIDGRQISKPSYGSPFRGDYEKSAQDIFQEVKSSIVYITTQKANGQGAIGSGFVIDSSGIIVTNYHVIIHLILSPFHHIFLKRQDYSFLKDLLQGRITSSDNMILHH